MVKPHPSLTPKRSRSRKSLPPRRRRPSVESLESRCLLAIITWDGGAGTFNWNEAANWDVDPLPGANDDAVIPDLTGSPTIVVSSGSVTIKSLQSAESLGFNGGTF